LQERLSDLAFGRGARRSSPASLVHGEQGPNLGGQQAEEVDEAIAAEEEHPRVSADDHGHERLDKCDSEHSGEPDDGTPVATARGVEEKVEDSGDQNERI